MKPATTIATALLLLISILHLLRIVFQVKVVANDMVIPLWFSTVACIVFAFIAFMVWRENKR